MPAPAPQKLTVSSIKSRLLNVAQTSLYQVNIVPAPGVRAFVGAAGRDIASLDTINLLCCDTALPGSSLATHDITNDYHGVTEKMAYRRIYDDSIDLTFYVDRNYNVIEFFDGWISYIVGEGSVLPRQDYKKRYVNYRMIYPKEYRSEITLTKFEKDHHFSGSTIPKETMTYTFVSAFPTNIISMPVSYESSNVLKCTVSFNYMRYVRERKVIAPSVSVPNPQAPGVPELNLDLRNNSKFTAPESYLQNPTFSVSAAEQANINRYYVERDLGGVLGREIGQI